MLKRSILTPSNLFVAPTVYTLEIVEDSALVSAVAGGGAWCLSHVRPLTPPPPLSLAQDSSYLHVGDAEVVGLPDASSQEDDAAGNGTDWLGCIVAPQALMAGVVLEVLDGVATVEECCRACRTLYACNVWNLCQELGGCRCAAGVRCALVRWLAHPHHLPSPHWACCPTTRNSCSYKDQSTEVSLQPGQCELRQQPLVQPGLGWPPAVLSKGQGVTFTGGSPVATVASPVDGFTAYPASGLFGQPGFECEGTLK